MRIKIKVFFKTFILCCWLIIVTLLLIAENRSHGSRKQYESQILMSENGSAVGDLNMFSDVLTSKPIPSPMLQNSVYSSLNVGYNCSGPKIPKIIHQVWDTHYIPGIFHPWMKSVVEQHPDWEYWFWTIDDVRKLISLRYPRFLQMFNSYQGPIFQTDAMRYFVLYTFGGFYIDLDVESLKPLDPWLEGHTCILPQENLEHSYIVNKASHPNIMTTILGCVPNHTFYNQIINALPVFARIYSNKVQRATGPWFLDGQYRSYMKRKKGTNNLSSKDGCSVGQESITVAESDLFLPTFDETQVASMKSTCKNAQHKLHSIGQRLCKLHAKDNWKNTHSLIKSRNKTISHRSHSYTRHYWVHVNLWSEAMKNKDRMHISEIIPTAKNVSDVLNYL